MDLNDFGKAVRRFWPICLAVLALCVALGYAIATVSGPTYRSSVTLSIAPNPAEVGSVEQVQFELPAVVEYVGSRSLGDQLIEELGAGVVGQVESLTGLREIESNIVRIEAEGVDARAVAAVANAAAEATAARYAPSDDDPLTRPTRGDLVDIDIIDPAVVDGSSGHPNLVAIMLAAFALGLILAGASAVAAQRISRSRDLEARIRAELGVPVLSVIPATRELTEGVPLGELIRTGPPVFVESFQSLRSQIERLLPEEETVLAVTSWQRREGRTSVAAGLGLMLSAVGEQSVVVDCNLRKPTLAETLQEPGRSGLAELATDPATEYLHHTKHARLDLIPAGTAHSHPAELLAVALPRALHGVWERSPRAVVVLDAPPIGPVLRGAVQRTAETSTVLGVANRVLLVMDSSQRHLSAVAAGLGQLEEQGVYVIGVVVNRRRVRNRWPHRGRRQAPSSPSLGPQQLPPAGPVPRAAANGNGELAASTANGHGSGGRRD
jgi:Mrp family chromosome partitioning ATPase/capsular polysaccharide biosynthesis protein